MSRLLCRLGFHLHRELRIVPQGDIDDPIFVPWWVCMTCDNRELF